MSSKRVDRNTRGDVDQKGYDRKGYDRDGYDRKGYDRDGYDRKGYDRDGYDRKGYDMKGYPKLPDDVIGIFIDIHPHSMFCSKRTLECGKRVLRGSRDKVVSILSSLKPPEFIKVLNAFVEFYFILKGECSYVLAEETLFAQTLTASTIRLSGPIIKEKLCYGFVGQKYTTDMGKMVSSAYCVEKRCEDGLGIYNKIHLHQVERITCKEEIFFSRHYPKIVNLSILPLPKVYHTISDIPPEYVCNLACKYMISYLPSLL